MLRGRYIGASTAHGKAGWLSDGRVVYAIEHEEGINMCVKNKWEVCNDLYPC